VVAEKGMDGTARARRFALEPPEQIQHFPRVGSAIEDVAGLDENGAATRPASTLVRDAGAAQDGEEGLVAAVHVTNGDDPFNRA
jgi:hypothetical protein